MITIPKSQSRILLEALTLGMLKLDDEINALTMAYHEGLVDGAYDEASDLISEREHVSRLHDVVLAEIGGTVAPYWPCRDEDCGWLNPLTDASCENCGEQR